MFIPFGGAPPIRHKGFSDINSVRDFITKRSMHSCFYSTAYWERPFEMKMADKNWFGADLIFDLDGDHLPGVTDRDFPGMLEVIREQGWTLWNDYLQPEFGFDEKVSSSYIFWTQGLSFALS
jgi:DNA primase small subunit